MSNIRQITGKNIRRLREEKNLTQEKLAEMVEVSGSYIGYLERGKQSPSLKLLGKIAEALGVQPDTLLVNPENVSEETEELRKLNALLIDKGPDLIRFMQEIAVAYINNLHK